MVSVSVCLLLVFTWLSLKFEPCLQLFVKFHIFLTTLHIYCTIFCMLEIRTFLISGRKPAQRKLLPSAVPSQFQWTASLTEAQKSRELRQRDRENKKRRKEVIIKTWKYTLKKILTYMY